MGGDEQVSTLFLVLFSIGVGAGATCCNRMLKGRVSGKYLTPSLLAISLFIALLCFVGKAVHTQELLTLAAFIKRPGAIFVCLSMFLIAWAGGLYSVPMYAMLQRLTPPTHMARVIASLNVVTSFYMVVAALLCAVLIAAGISIRGLFLLMGMLNLLMLPITKKLSGINDN